MRRILLSAIALVFCLSAVTLAGQKIAVIPKGTTHDFWKSVHAGARKAAGEVGVEVIWQGPQLEDDRTKQIEVVENFINQGVDGIVLAPLDYKALVEPVENAVKAGIKVVTFDSALDSDLPSCFVATNSYIGGQEAARAMASFLGGTGKIVVLRYLEGSASTM